MADSDDTTVPKVGSPNMRLPDELRQALHSHLHELRQAYAGRGWGKRVGFGSRPALIVVDLALAWTQRPHGTVGTNLEPVVEATVAVLAAARAVDVPIFFTTGHHDRSEPVAPAVTKFEYPDDTDFATVFSLDPRLERRCSEKLIAKPYASAFKGTHLGEMLSLLHVDTLIVTGCSTSECVYATCRDALETYRVIVPAEAVGERCELMHEVNLFNIDISMGDVLPVGEVVDYLGSRAGRSVSAAAR